MSKAIALILLILSAPLWPILYLAVKLDSKGPFIFKQKRAGKDKKPFVMYKVRTMIDGAEKLQSKYSSLNEADGPVFKIKDDPRYTRVGRILARLALDEIPQLWNVICGNMALVGPRPLPLLEAAKIPNKYSARFSVLPGMSSAWIVGGGHQLPFERWMKLDLEYVKRKSTFVDLKILLKTIKLIYLLALGTGQRGKK